MKLAVIIGAGASHDCAGQDQRTNNDWQPPLVNQLFEPRHQTFGSILSKYPGAEALSEEIRMATRAGKSLEDVLRNLGNRQSQARQRQFYQIPLYLQELFGEISQKYMTAGGSKFDTLVGAIEDADHYDDVMYLTLNYDLFLEKALARLHSLAEGYFSQLGCYLKGNGFKWSLIKLHGSVSWGRELASHYETAFHNDPIGLIGSCALPLELGPFRTLAGHVHQQRIAGDRFCFPALALPIAGKTEFVCPDEHVAAARSFLLGCADYLFIGFSGNDSHVTDLLKGVSCVNKVWVVNGPMPDGKAAVLKLLEKNSLFGNPHDTPINVGFSGFAVPDKLSAFLRDTRS